MSETHFMRRNSLAYRIGYLFGIPLLLMLLANITNAQTTNPNDGSTPPGLAPGAPAGSYPLSGFDNVNPFSGALNFRLPLYTVGGRGDVSHTILLALDFSHWTVTHQTQVSGCSPAGCNYSHTYYPGGGWGTLRPGYGPGVLQGRRASDTQCNPGTPNPTGYYEKLTRLTFTTSDGTEYEMRDVLTGGAVINNSQYTCYNSTQTPSRGTIFVTADGTAATFISDAPIYDISGHHDVIYPSGTLTLRNGTRYRIVNGLVEWMSDRNGNKLTFTNDTAYKLMTAIKDSLNREVTIAYANLGNPQVTDDFDEISFKGFGGTPRTIRIWYSHHSDVLRTGYSLQSPFQLFDQMLNGASTTVYNYYRVSSVELANGLQYYFKYNSYGELARVDLPTGGAYEYDFAAGVNDPIPSGVVERQLEKAIYRRLVERRVYPNGGTVPESRTTYSRPESYSGINNLGYVIVEHLNGSGTTVLRRTKHYYHGSVVTPMMFQRPTQYPALLDGKEYKTEDLDTTTTDPNLASVLRRVEYLWQPGTPLSQNPTQPANPRVVEIKTTLLDSNQVTKQTFSYDQYNNQTDIYEYDYGSGTAGNLVRRKHTDYANATNLINGLDYTTTDIHLRSLPTQQWISSDANGSNKQALVTYEYDKHTQDSLHAPLKTYTDISGLDAAYTANYTKRGNVTRITRYKNAATTTGPVTSAMQYDMAGNVVKTIDGRGYPTEIDFTDCFGSPDTEAQSNTVPSELGTLKSYAFPTKITNALGHVSFTQYSYYLGAQVNSEDANEVVSSTEYGNGGLDLLDRPSKQIRAINQPSIKNQSKVIYDDANRIITRTTDLNTFDDIAPLKSEVVYDGLGRTIETRHYETSFAFIKSIQQYDELSRLKRSYNPHRTSADPTYGWTESIYDELSRVKRIETFRADGAGSASTGFVTTNYFGNEVTVTDQAGKSRKTVTDALGRLIKVYEDPSNLNYLTIYGYNSLDDLTNVTQGGQQRTFVYDSLKRLTSATNPESATVEYEYDQHGNVTKKTDPRFLGDGITQVKVDYLYDPLNRLTNRNYNDGTPNVTYTYDAESVAKSKGRLTNISSIVSTYSFSAYDGLGRVTSGNQTTDGLSYPMSYSYDRAGNLKTQTYPSGRTVSVQYDNAGRIAGLRNEVMATYYAGAVATDDISRIQYSAHGAITDVKLGNGLWEHTSFNSRLQPTEIGLGVTQGSSGTVRLNYTYGLFENGMLDTTKNNGNVESQTITVPNLTLTQSYLYDSLNRLKSAIEKQGSTESWKQAYIYDRFGNRRIDSNSTNTTPALVGDNPVISDGSNRILPQTGEYYRYDAAGNLDREKLINRTYVYDAENRVRTFDDSQTQGVDATYTYDGSGRRVRKIVGASRIVFVYNVLGQLVAEYGDFLPASVGGTSYLTADHLSTPRVITKADGAVAGRHDYLPFGEEILSTYSGRSGVTGYGVDEGIRQKYTAEERDNETGLDYFGARYYVSMQGRFTSCDPLIASGRTAMPQSWNRYAYVLNNPVKLTDPTGMGESDPIQRPHQQPLPPPRPPLDPSLLPFASLPPVPASPPSVVIFELGLPPVPQAGPPIPALSSKNQVGSEERSRSLIQTTTEILFVDQYGNRLTSDGQTYLVTETIIEVSRTPDVPPGEGDVGVNEPLSPNGTIPDTHILRPNTRQGFREFTDDMKYERNQIVEVTNDRTGTSYIVGLFKLETTLKGLSITNCNRGCQR